MKKKSLRYRITYNAPVTITFCVIALIALGLGYLTDDRTTDLLFSVHRYGSPLYSPLTWVRFVTHVLGHADLDHYIGNIILILVLGPGLEDRLGSKKLFFAMLFTAILAGAVEYIFFPDYKLLGASGIVFMMLILSSAGSAKRGELPLTLILVFCFYVGSEVVDGVFLSDNVSQLTHIIGGVCGAITAIRKA